MKITKTAKVKIISHNHTFDSTLTVYNQALSFFINVVNSEWLSIIDKSSNIQQQIIENLTHQTTKNPNVKYNFDKPFPKFPSYLRRACINEAIGHVSSHHSRYDNWLKDKKAKAAKGKKFFKKPPTLQLEHKSFPVFYKTNMFNRLSENQAGIKIYKDNDWKWLTITFNHKNLLNRDLENYKELNPSLVRSGKKYYLHIPFQKVIKLPDISKGIKITIGVDLGLTNSAVCSAMLPDGTVIGRKFINQPIEKDQLNTALSKLKKANRQSGKTSKPNIWRKINNCQKQVVQNTVDQVVDFAKDHQAELIVFEHLGRMKIPKGFFGAKRLRFKLQFWAKQKIQNITTAKAHAFGMRVNKVLARGTSKFAYDGSGEVVRNGRRDICKFHSGKTYHSDLSASYNIASRSYIREFLKPLSETVRLGFEAKVPEISDRASQTLASLIRLRSEVNTVCNSGVSRIHAKEAPSIAEGLGG